MMNNARTIRRFGWALALIVPLAACERGPSPEVQAQIDELQATRDSLTRELAEQTEKIQDLSRSIDEAAGEVPGPGVASPEVLGDRISNMTEELEATRAQLADARRRIRALSSRSSTLRDSLSALAERNEALAMQRDSLTDLVAEMDSIENRAEELAAERLALASTLSGLEEKYYTVYYVVGTKDELVERGIIEEEGGARVLLVLWKAGETMVPSRDLEREQFEAIDFRETTEIDLPAQGTYKLVSRHDTDYLEPTPDDEGRFTGSSLRITQPEEFWRPSRYLILVAEG